MTLYRQMVGLWQFHLIITYHLLTYWWQNQNFLNWPPQGISRPSLCCAMDLHVYCYTSLSLYSTCMLPPSKHQRKCLLLTLFARGKDQWGMLGLLAFKYGGNCRFFSLPSRSYFKYTKCHEFTEMHEQRPPWGSTGNEFPDRFFVPR